MQTAVAQQGCCSLSRIAACRPTSMRRLFWYKLTPLYKIHVSSCPSLSCQNAAHIMQYLVLQQLCQAFGGLGQQGSLQATSTLVCVTAACDHSAETSYSRGPQPKQNHLVVANAAACDACDVCFVPRLLGLCLRKCFLLKNAAMPLISKS